MTKDIIATRKAFGDSKFGQVTLRVPDKVGALFKDYNIQIVDYPNQDTVIFLCGDGYDVDSITFKGHANNFVHAIKTLYERRIEEEK